MKESQPDFELIYTDRCPVELEPDDDWYCTDPFEPEYTEDVDIFVEPNWGQAALPNREFQISVTLSESVLSEAEWPPYAVAQQKIQRAWGNWTFIAETFGLSTRPFRQVIAESEATDDPFDIKNARLIGMIAALSSDELDSNPVIRAWGLGSHLGMAHALGAALVSGLPLSRNAIELAANFHHFNKVTDATNKLFTAEEIYMSPGSEPIMHEIRYLIRRAYIGGLRGGIDRFLEYWTDYIDDPVRHLPPGRRIKATYSERDENPAYDTYRFLLGQVQDTETALLLRSEEVERLIMRKLAHYKLMAKQIKHEEWQEREAKRQARTSEQYVASIAMS